MERRTKKNVDHEVETPEIDAVEETSTPVNEWETNGGYSVFVDEAVSHPKSKTVLVRLINKHEFQGRYAVENVHTHKVRLVEVGKILYTLGDQEILLEDFDKGIEPYDWFEEIEQLYVTVDQIKLTLYAAGFFEKGDFDVRKMRAALLQHGIAPLR